MPKETDLVVNAEWHINYYIREYQEIIKRVYDPKNMALADLCTRINTHYPDGKLYIQAHNSSIPSVISNNTSMSLKARAEMLIVLFAMNGYEATESEDHKNDWDTTATRQFRMKNEQTGHEFMLNIRVTVGETCEVDTIQEPIPENEIVRTRTKATRIVCTDDKPATPPTPAPTDPDKEELINVRF